MAHYDPLYEPTAQGHMYPETEEHPTLGALAHHFARSHALIERKRVLKMVPDSKQDAALEPLERYCAALIARMHLTVVSYPRRGDLMAQLESALQTPLRLEASNGLLPLICACAYWSALEQDVYLSGLSVQPVMESLCGYKLYANERLNDQTLRMWIPFLAPALQYLTEAHRVGTDGRKHINIPDLLCPEHLSMLQRMEHHVPGIDAFHHRDLGMGAMDIKEGA